jgi:pimeloyl-ACP methyl ester carboxylesterase
MKKTHLSIFIAIQLLWVGCESDKKPVPYGSNDGKQVNIRGSNIYYEEYGKGMPLLLLSGGGISRSIKDFEKCIPGLSQHYRVIAPDTPGQGRSDQPDTLTYDIIADTMSKLIDSLNVDSVYIMGWSDGGIVSILLAERRPDKVKKVIAVGANNGTTAFNIPPDVSLDSIKPPTMEQYKKWNEKVIEDYEKFPGKKDWKKLQRSLNTMWYAREYFPKSIYGGIKNKVMIVLGDRDEIMVPHGLEMQKAINGSEFCVLPNTSHDVFKEKPELINQIAIDFFKN